MRALVRRVSPSEDDHYRGVLDVLDHGRDGIPRLVHLEARSPSAAARLIHRVTHDAEARGFVVRSVGAGTLPGWCIFTPQSSMPWS